MITTIATTTPFGETLPATMPGVVQKCIDGLTFPFTGTAQQRMDVVGVRYAVVLYSLASMILASKVTRNRVANGADPILSVLF
jgi:hypothetical protein